MENSYIEHDSSLIGINRQTYHCKLYSTSTGHFAFDAVPNSPSQSNPNNSTPSIIAASTQGNPKMRHN
jgi:hypothetical protein